MPPASDPILLKILDELETTLALPDGGSDYFYDIQVVRIGEDIFQHVGPFPAVTIGIGELGTIAGTEDGKVLWHEALHWRLVVIGAIEGTEDAHRRLLKLVHDIHRAVSADRSRGGYAYNTSLEGVLVLPPIDETDTRSWVEITFLIRLRTSDTTMLTD